ncbi:MAG: hypothetical protein IJO47_04970 [Clostridia bacterium]|nr:hypothetical protein [Clostridia bacterium]
MEKEIMNCTGNCASCGSSSSCSSAEIAEPTGCTGNCATCGGCSSSSDTLDLGELALMFELMETPFLPVCRFIMTKAGEEDTVRMTALAPVYFNAVDTTMEEAKQIGEALLHLEDKGIITLDYEVKLENYDYVEYRNSDLYKEFKKTVAEGAGKEGFLCDTAVLDMGSMALTAKGRAMIEYLSMGM